MSVLALVPARGGSKGLPGKNLRSVGGLSLTARAVLAGRDFVERAALRDACVAVDTDDDAIAAEGRRFGAEVPFLRPESLAGDDTPTHTSVLHFVDRLAEAGRRFDTIVLLQPTSPLRTADDILQCWRRFDRVKSPSVVAVTPQEHPVDFAMRLTADDAIEWISGIEVGAERRQDFAQTFRISGAVYVITVAMLRERKAFTVSGKSCGVVITNDRSIDVDSATDLSVADALARATSRETLAFSVEDRSLGGGAPCYVIAEAGVNHNGDTALAHRLIDVAADAGADAVKFQTFNPDALAAPDARQATYQTVNTGIEESQLSMLRKLVLPAEAYVALQKHARDRALAFLSTPFDESSADFLESLGMPVFKIPSGELTNLALISHIARKGRPMLISTGMADMAEVAEGVRTVRMHSEAPLALFHCVTDYPADPAECNLSAMASMRAAFGVPVGWSDHTSGLDVTLAAVALGAEIIEKHFTLDRALPGPDHMASLEPHELRALIAKIRVIESTRGDGVKGPVAVERDYAALVRRSLYARNNMDAGHTLRAEDVVALRPGDGLPPAALPRLIGLKVRSGVSAGARLTEDDFA